MNENIFDKLDFGPLKPILDNDDITDISYCNGGQIWIRSLTQGSIRIEVPGCTPEFMEKLAFQCSNVMGTTFNNAKPFLDAESSELRLNFVHQSIATNGIACVIRKTPAKIRLEKEKLLNEDYFTADIHDILIKCVEGHCNIIVSGETGSGKTEFVKYLASHTKNSEKIITIEDTLELHLDRIFPQRDIVAMKTNNVASYSDVLVTCMRQNPKWILLSEVRSAEAVTAVRNSISSGHNILSTIHADKASAIPYRLYSLLESDIDVEQFLTTIYRYIQIGVHIKAYYSKKYGKFHREVDEVVEFYVDDNNVPRSHTIYRKLYDKSPLIDRPSAHLIEYLSNQNVDITNITNSMEARPFDQDIGSASNTDNREESTENTIQETIVKGEENSSDSITNNNMPNLEQNITPSIDNNIQSITTGIIPNQEIISDNIKTNNIEAPNIVTPIENSNAYTNVIPNVQNVINQQPNNNLQPIFNTNELNSIPNQNNITTSIPGVGITNNSPNQNTITTNNISQPMSQPLNQNIPTSSNIFQSNTNIPISNNNIVGNPNSQQLNNINNTTNQENNSGV
ncbi:MAG: Flp pilus assembly complex ATPase component TadA [Bacilli bacterium]|nr:Flp pilus assembly complex ATPase component TadA [Bacilli bacterium]